MSIGIEGSEGRRWIEWWTYQRTKKRTKHIGSMSDQMATVAVWMRL